MNFAKKMVLVPEQTLERLERRKNVSTPPLTTKLNDLDASIEQLLKDKSLSEDEKVRQYSQALQNYLHYYNERKDQPITVKLQQPAPKIKEAETPQEAHEENTQEPHETPIERNFIQEIVNALPKTLKVPGKALLQKIKENPEIMKWNEQGELVLDGKTLHGTHITDLIKDSLRGNKGSNGPIVWELFTQGLARINTPDHLIRNAQRKSALRHYKTGTQAASIDSRENTNEWFPPPMVSSPGPMRNKGQKKEARQRWLTFR